MTFVGIDIGAERHWVAAVDADGAVVLPALPFAEDAAGYAALQAALERLAEPPHLVVLEATGHYWQNLFAVLVSAGHAVAVLNPRRSHHFAQADLRRAKTDALDAVGLARFGAEKRPAPTPLSDRAARELRERVRLRARLLQEQGDRTRQLHRLVDLVFPELARHVKTLHSPLATTILATYPTAHALRRARVQRLARLVYDGRHHVGEDLARGLVAAAQRSVGQHHGPVYEQEVRFLCEDLVTLRRRLQGLERDIAQTLRQDPLGGLLLTIDGIGPKTAATLLAEVGDPARFRDAAALGAYVGVAPGTWQSGQRRLSHAGLAPTGHAALRRALWLPTLVAVRTNAWLRAFYQRLVARGKPKKVALIAAMRKLLSAIYSVAKHRRAFIPLAPPQEAAA